LKPARGKRVALKISNKAPYAEVQSKGREKWKAYHSNDFAEDEEYSLVYQDGQEALFLPGTREFFTLKRYKEESGKDYKRITLYLCSKDDLRRNENFNIESEEFEESEDEWEEPTGKKSKFQFKQDEIIARELQFQLDNEDPIHIPDDDEDAWNTTEKDTQQLDAKDKSNEVLSEDSHGNSDLKPVPEETKKYQSITDVVQALGKEVDQSQQFFFVIRRGSTLQRKLTIWQREARKKSPKHRVMVHFAGESGIDNGALAKEFFTNLVSEIGENIFPNGSPKDSMLDVHNGTFYTCGQIVAASIAQGGPPPSFLEDCVYAMLVNSNVDLSTLVPQTHLTSQEQALLEAIKNDPITLQDIILEHAYTGKIDKDHVDDIVGTVMVSLVSKRLLYLDAFRKGLDLYGLPELIQLNGDLCKHLFVIGQGGKAADANYVVSCLMPYYSDEGSNKRTIEEGMVDSFQDLLINFEDEQVTGYTEALACNDGEDSIANTEGIHDERSSYQSPDLTPAGVLGWLTGQKHVPINGENLKIHVNFDHDCMVRNNMHTICFPIVGSCGREITLPVEHMKTTEDFQRVFMIAFCKSQQFGNR
jgi:hypothetical protein